MFRGVGAAVTALSALVLAVAVPANASTSARYGIQDDAWLLDGPGTLSSRVSLLRGLGVGVVRFTLRWDKIAPSEPTDPRDPGDEAYQWGASGEVLDALHARGINTLVTLDGSPPWANGGHPANRLPTTGFGNFAYAASRRFPWIHMWTAWNEPNTTTFSAPVSPTLYVQHVLNPAYAALHAVSPANLVAGGVTSPRRTPTGMAPLAFMKGMHAAHARLDAYAQNPYSVGRDETPFTGACATCGYFTMARLAAIRADVTKYFGPKPLWLTEYGYQTNPPDRLLGVSYALQARYIGEAALHVWEQPGVTVLIQFLVRDEPDIGGWQSGLFRADGTPKPSYHAFALPLAVKSRHGTRTVLWGQVRPGSGPRTYVLERSSRGRWVPIGGSARTGRGGTFLRTVTLARGARVRIWAPSIGWSSPPLPVA